MQLQIIMKMQKQLSWMIEMLTNMQKQLDFYRMTDKNQYIYQTTKNLLGQKLRTIGKELACAETINAVWKIITGRTIGGGTSTLKMFNKVILNKRFIEVTIDNRKAGDLFIAPTGNHLRRFITKVEHGHCWILLKDDILASNNSETGLLDDHWTVGGALNYYRDKHGFQVRVFRAV